MKEDNNVGGFVFDLLSGVRPSWNATRLMMRERLSDRKIEKYRKMGWYSHEFKAQRKELMEKRASKRQKREGSFVRNEEGRMVYSPL